MVALRRAIMHGKHDLDSGSGVGADVALARVPQWLPGSHTCRPTLIADGHVLFSDARTGTHEQPPLAISSVSHHVPAHCTHACMYTHAGLWRSRLPRAPRP